MRTIGNMTLLLALNVLILVVNTSGLMAAAAAQPAAFKADAHTLQLWHFDQATAGVTKEGIKGIEGKFTGGVELTQGKFGSALKFNGTDGAVKLLTGNAITIEPAQSLTVEATVKVNKQGQTQPIFAASPYVELEVRRENGAASFNLRSVDDAENVRCTGKTNIADGKWHHVAGVRDAGNGVVRLYIDGKLDGEVPDATAKHKLIITDGALVGGNAMGTEMLGGAIDELRISSAARYRDRATAAGTAAGAAAAASAIPADAQKQVLENGQVRLTFATFGSRAALASLFDKTRNVEFISPTRFDNLWQASFRNADRVMAMLDEQQAPLEVKREQTADGEQIEFRWSGLPLDGKPNQADVIMTVLLPTDSPLSQWRIRIDNHSKEYGLWIATYPHITNLAKLSDDGSDCLALPGGNGGGAGEGQLYKDPFKSLTHSFVRTYPCYHQSMQFNAYYNDKAGLYLATHDGKMNLKGFHILPQTDPQNPTVLYELQLYPADAGVAGTGIDQDYPQMIGPFGGDWYDASQIYRDWALKQVWAQKGPLEQRTDITPWIREGSYWMVGTFEWEPTDQPPMRRLARSLPIEEARKRVRNIDVDKSLAMVREAREFFDFPLLLWTNEWFDGGGDISPPRYMPMGNLDKYMAQLHQEFPDVHVSGHMQMKRYSVQLAEYNKEVEKALEWTQDGKLAIEPLDAMDKGDQIAYPCWYTDFWYNFWNNKAREIVSATGLDGFHCDELASATSFDAQCFNPNHGHPIGGGTLYADTRRKNVPMLRNSARSVKPGFAIHHEALSEIYIDIADLAEVCTAPSNINIPLYEAVYHDYVFVMGRRIHPWMDRRTFPVGDAKYGDNDMNQFVASFSTTFVWGNQPGWTRLDIVQYSPKVAAYIRQMMHARYRNMKFLNTGRYIRPLTVTKELPTVTNIWTTCDTPEVTQPVILNSVWKASDGSIGIVLANITDQPQTISYAYDLSEAGGDHGAWKLRRTEGESPSEIGTVAGGKIERSDEVPPRSVIVIEASPQQ